MANKKKSVRDGADGGFVSKRAEGEARNAIQRPVGGSFPAWYDLIVWFGFFIAAQLIGGVVALALGCGPQAGVGEMTPDEAGWMLAVSGGVAYVLMLAGVLIYRRARGGHGRVMRMSIRGFDPLFLLWGVVFMLAVGVVLEPLLGLLPAPPSQIYGTGFWTILAVVVLAPLFEELICRGVVLESLRSRFGVIGAWGLSSLFFGVIHLQPQLMVNALFMGMILGYVAIRTGSLWSAIILHAINNSIAYVALTLGIDSIKLSELIADPKLYGVVYGLCALLSVVSAVMAGRVLRRLDRTEREKMTPEA